MATTPREGRHPAVPFSTRSKGIVAISFFLSYS